MLEIASGSGQHAVMFQKHFPNIIWQASDPNPLHRRSINAWISYERLGDVMPAPLDLDVDIEPWPFLSKGEQTISAIVCINLIHVCSWESAKALFKGAAKTLDSSCPLFLYGPFMRKGYHTSKSNEIFDKSLRLSNSLWGVRGIEELKKISKEEGFLKQIIYTMPSNNFSIIYYKN